MTAILTNIMKMLVSQKKKPTFLFIWNLALISQYFDIWLYLWWCICVHVCLFFSINWLNNKWVLINKFFGSTSVVLPPWMQGLQGAAGATGAAWAQEGGALAGGGQAVRWDTFPQVSVLFHLSRARWGVSAGLWSGVTGCCLSVTVKS